MERSGYRKLVIITPADRGLQFASTVAQSSHSCQPLTLLKLHFLILHRRDLTAGSLKGMQFYLRAYLFLERLVTYVFQ